MADELKELTDQQLLNVLKAARELELNAAFIRLIESELVRRGHQTLTDEGKGVHD